MLESITIEPEGECWAHALSAAGAQSDSMLFHRPLSEWRKKTRAKLFGEIERPILATGHQAEFWHPGILAKFLAAEAIARPIHAEVVELIPDQDTNDPLAIRVPRFVDGRLTVETITLANEPASSATIPTGCRKPVTVRPIDELLPESFETLDSVRAGIAAMVEAMNARLAATSLAEQVTLANLAVRAMMNGGAPAVSPRILMASRLTHTRLWPRFIEAMREDPTRVFESYNTAIANHAHARVGPLTQRVNELEMPVWVIEEDGSRHHAFADDLDRDPATLWPRALLMSGFMRLAVCDFFIHGKSGAVYDRATEDWLADWLGISLCPAGMTTADLYLDFNGRGANACDLARAQWNAHHIRHHLDEHLDDPTTSKRRANLLQQIKLAPRRSAERSAAYFQLHDLRTEINQKHADLIAQADNAVDEIRSQLLETDVVRNRTWAFALHTPAALGALKSGIETQSAVRLAPVICTDPASRQPLSDSVQDPAPRA